MRFVQFAVTAGVLAGCGPGFGWEKLTVGITAPSRVGGGSLVTRLTLADPHGELESNCDRLKALWVLVNGDVAPDQSVEGTCDPRPGLPREGDPPPSHCKCGLARWSSIGSARVDADALMHVSMHDGRTERRVTFADPRAAARPTLAGPSLVTRGSEIVLDFPSSFTAPCDDAADRRLELGVIDPFYRECGATAERCEALTEWSVVRSDGALRFTVPANFQLPGGVTPGPIEVIVEQSCTPVQRECGFGGGCEVTIADHQRIALTIDP